MDDERPQGTFLGCVGRFLIMGIVTWLVLLGTVLLIYARWVKH